MIKLTINDLLNVIPILRELANKPFKGAITFKIARLIRELNKEATLFEESRRVLIEKYGVRKEDGSFEVLEDGTIKLQEDQIQECSEEMNTLLNTEIEINADKIPAETFDNIEISPSQIIILESLVNF